MCSGAGVFVALHAAGAAPAAPAPPAGPHAARRAAGVRAGLAHSTTTPLCGALPSSTSGTHTCWTSTKPVRLKPKCRVNKAGEQCDCRPTVLFEGALSALSGLWCFRLGAVAAAVPVAGSTDITVP